MIKERLDELAEQISLIDPDDVFHYLMDRGQRFSGVPEWANDTNRVPGCMSRLWANVDLVPTGIEITTCSDSLLVDGTARVVADIINGVPLEQARGSISELDRIPSLLGLSSQRRNGLANLIIRIRKELLA